MTNIKQRCHWQSSFGACLHACMLMRTLSGKKITLHPFHDPFTNNKKMAVLSFERHFEKWCGARGAWGVSVTPAPGGCLPGRARGPAAKRWSARSRRTSRAAALVTCCASRCGTSSWPCALAPAPRLLCGPGCCLHCGGLPGGGSSAQGPLVLRGCSPNHRLTGIIWRGPIYPANQFAQKT